MFCMKIDNDLLHRRIENQLSPILFFPIFFHSSSLQFFVKDISITVIDRMFLLGTQNNNDKSYREIENRLCPISSFLYLFTFLSLHAVSTVGFWKKISQRLFKIEDNVFCM